MVKSLGSAGIAITLVSAFLVLALLAELYYLLWWKKQHRTTVPTTKRRRKVVDSHALLLALLSRYQQQRTGCENKFIFKCKQVQEGSIRLLQGISKMHGTRLCTLFDVWTQIWN